MSAGKAIYAQLAGDAPVAAIVGTRIYPELAPEQETFPVIVYHLSAGDSGSSYAGNVSPMKHTLTILAVVEKTPGAGSPYATLDDLGVKIKAALDDQAGTWGGVVVQGAFFEDQSDDVITIGDEADRRFYIREQTYTVWVTES